MKNIDGFFDLLILGCRSTQIDNRTLEMVTDVRHVLLAEVLPAWISFIFPRYRPSEHGESVCGGRRHSKALSKADKDSAEVAQKRLLAKEHIGK